MGYAWNIMFARFIGFEIKSILEGLKPRDEIYLEFVYINMAIVK